MLITQYCRLLSCIILKYVFFFNKEKCRIMYLPLSKFYEMGYQRIFSCLDKKHFTFSELILVERTVTVKTT